MASDTRSPSTPGTKSWEVAKIRPRKLLARIMLGRRISTVRDLGGRTESLKQKNQLETYSKTQLILEIMTLLGKRRT